MQSRGNPQSGREKLPLIVRPPRTQPSTSVISVSKYLHVNRGNSEEEGKEEDPTAEESNSALSSAPCSQSHLLEDTPPSHTQPERATWPSFPATTLDPLFDNLGKEEILRRKADSLGLLSHKWARSFLERGFMNGSLPHRLYQTLSRPATREENRQAGPESPRTESRLTSRKQKMERLESVYGQKFQRQTSAKTPRHNLNSSVTATTTSPSRPPTRGDPRHSTALHKLSQRLREAHPSSRPPTRAGKHHKTSITTSRPIHRRWRTEEVGSPLAPPTQLLEGVLGVTHQQCY